MYQCATCLGQMSKQSHAGAIKPESGFCASGFGFFQSDPERQLPVPLDKDNGGSGDDTGRLRAGSLHVIPG